MKNSTDLRGDICPPLEPASATCFFDEAIHAIGRQQFYGVTFGPSLRQKGPGVTLFPTRNPHVQMVSGSRLATSNMHPKLCKSSTGFVSRAPAGEHSFSYPNYSPRTKSEGFIGLVDGSLNLPGSTYLFKKWFNKYVYFNSRSQPEDSTDIRLDYKFPSIFLKFRTLLIEAVTLQTASAKQ